MLHKPPTALLSGCWVLWPCSGLALPWDLPVPPPLPPALSPPGRGKVTSCNCAWKERSLLCGHHEESKAELYWKTWTQGMAPTTSYAPLGVDLDTCRKDCTCKSLVSRSLSPTCLLYCFSCSPVFISFFCPTSAEHSSLCQGRGKLKPPWDTRGEKEQ